MARIINVDKRIKNMKAKFQIRIIKRSQRKLIFNQLEKSRKIKKITLPS